RRSSTSISTASTACSNTGSSRSCARGRSTPNARPWSRPRDFERRPGSSSGGTAFASLHCRGHAEEECCMPRWLSAVSAWLLDWSGGAVARTGPGRPIRAIVAFAAGSATDVIPRVVFEPLSVQLGQPIVVENRGGAGTTIAGAMVAKAEPDGYTLLATSSAHTLVPTVYPNASYDTAADFAAAVSLGTSPNVLVVSPSKGFKTARDLVAAAKASPGSFNFASAGVGTATHLSAERFRMAAGFDAVHIPFRGGAEALSEVLSGRAEFYFCPLGTALP